MKDPGAEEMQMNGERSTKNERQLRDNSDLDLAMVRGGIANDDYSSSRIITRRPWIVTRPSTI